MSYQIPVAVVCRPDFLETLRDAALISELKELIYVPDFSGLAIHEKEGQQEAWKLFYNVDELHKYLTDNGTKPISQKNDEIAEMLERNRNLLK